MAKHDRGVYEPSSDDIRAFDGGEDDLDEEGSRLPLLIVIALLVLAAFGGVVWLAYSQGLQRGREGAPQMIAAQPGPVRTAPANPGGSTPYQGLKIYEQPAPAEDESAPAESAPAPAVAPKPKAETPAVKEAAKMKPAESEPPAAKESAKTQVAQAPKPAEVQPAPVKAETAAVPPPAKPAAEKPATGGDYVLQIGAYKSEAEANAAWSSYQRKHPIVGGYAPDILKVDLGDKGTWYRVRIGAFADRAAANLFCDKLKADGGGCFLAKK